VSEDTRDTGTKILDYIALGLLLAPPAVVCEMAVRGEHIDLVQAAIATAACWVAGGLVVWASHNWKSWQSEIPNAVPYLAAAEEKFWVKGLIVAAAMGGALALSSTLSHTPAPPRAPEPITLPSTAIASGKIIWDFDQLGSSPNFLLISKYPNDDIRIMGFTAHGRNQAREPITDLSGFIRSDLTNEEKPILIIAEPELEEKQPGLPPNVTFNVPTPPEDTNGIPGFAEFSISTYGKVFATELDGIPASKFVRDFGPFTLFLKYDGVVYQRHFSADQIDEQISRAQKGTITPHVTRKPTAKPVPILPPGLTPSDNGTQTPK
jgi:hypothetical protein